MIPLTASSSFLRALLPLLAHASLYGGGVADSVGRTRCAVADAACFPRQLSQSVLLSAWVTPPISGRTSNSSLQSRCRRSASPWTDRRSTGGDGCVMAFSASDTARDRGEGAGGRPRSQGTGLRRRRRRHVGGSTSRDSSYTSNSFDGSIDRLGGSRNSSSSVGDVRFHNGGEQEGRGTEGDGRETEAAGGLGGGGEGPRDRGPDAAESSSSSAGSESDSGSGRGGSIGGSVGGSIGGSSGGDGASDALERRFAKPATPGRETISEGLGKGLPSPRQRLRLQQENLDMRWRMARKQNRTVCCRQCAGQGVHECRFCAGTGFFKIGSELIVHPTSGRPPPCPVCRSKGEETCLRCKGAGRIAAWLLRSERAGDVSEDLG